MDTEPQGTSEAPKAKVEPVITFENRGKASKVTIQDVDSLFQSIASYNDQFSLGKSMFSLVMQHMERNMKPEDEQVNTPLTSKIDEESQHMSASALSVIHESTLNNIGLSLEPVSGKSATIYSSEGAVGTGEMRLNIKDREQFGAFLKALTPEQVSQTPLGSHLGELTGILNKQILDNYDLKEPDDSALTFLGSLDGIVTEYRRLGLDEPAEQMGEYLEHSRAGNLREFVALRTSGLLQEPGNGFGPADWQIDASPQFLQRKWLEALRLLRHLRNNPKSQEMYKQLFDHLNKCMNISLSSVDGIGYITPERKEEFKQILSDSKDSLSGFGT